MKICGIIAEYNPLHQGHEYHLSEARRQSGCDYLVAVMSGSFVQRGEPAAFDKWQRARWALAAGADAVFELPCVFSLQSAEGFARGGVRLLNSLGATHLSFGSEEAELQKLEALLPLLEQDPALLQEQLQQGKTFARARTDALAQAGAQEATLALLRSPNAILALEYLRALRSCAPHIKPVPVLRRGDGYNEEALGGNFSSARAIRRAWASGNIAGAEGALPAFVRQDLQLPPASLENLEQIFLYVLRNLSPAELAEIAGVEEGLENRFLQGARLSSLEELLAHVKSKRYTLARLKRILCCAALGITKEQVRQANSLPPYKRLLGYRKEARPLLQIMSLDSPLLCRKADFDALAEPFHSLLEIDFRASDLQALAFKDERRRTQRDFTEKIIAF